MCFSYKHVFFTHHQQIVIHFVVEKKKSERMFKVIALSATATVLVSAHGRWKCPLPRDANDEYGNHITFDNTGNKVCLTCLTLFC